MKKRTYYYHDLKNDDFAATNIKKTALPEDYKYVDRNIFYRAGELAIRCIAWPIVFLILKVGYLQRVRNRKVLKSAKGRCCFIFGNHTDYMLDAYNPAVLTFPRWSHIIANPDAVSIRGLGTVVKMLGVVPIPTSLKGMKNYLQGINKLIELKRVIAIYPEAHIWPYYTDIRPFGTESFHYAADAGAPCFTCTNIYQQRKLKLIRRPKVVTYVDGPFYPDMSLHRMDRIRKLRDEIYSAMKARVDENPRYDYCEYIYVEDASLATNKKN